MAMLRHATAPAIVRKRGNPNWGQSMPLGRPALATQFEIEVRHLRLTPDTYFRSATLHSWCEENRNRYYIPEWLLEAWGMSVDANLTDAA